MQIVNLQKCTDITDRLQLTNYNCLPTTMTNVLSDQYAATYKCRI